jgi:hypothetical protein
MSRNVNPSDVVELQAVAGGDHGDTAFQFGAAVTAKLRSGYELSYGLLSSELICRKDTAALLEATILPHLTKGLKIISEQPLHLYKTDDDSLICTFYASPVKVTDPTKISVEIYSTGDLAYQVIGQGREGMSGVHCMLCQLTYKEFNNDRDRYGQPWTFDKLTRIAKEVLEK